MKNSTVSTRNKKKLYLKIQKNPTNLKVKKDRIVI